jgi:hypothetical protein
MQKTFDQLLPIEREFLMKQRQGVLDQLAFIERKLNMPSSVLNKQQRRDVRRAEGNGDAQSDSR